MLSTLNVTGTLCFRLHTDNIYVQVTALDRLKAPKVTDASVPMHVQQMILKYYMKGILINSRLIEQPPHILKNNSYS